MIVLIGITGAGKTVQGKLLASQLNCPWVSTGVVIKKHLKEGHDLSEVMDGKIFDEQKTFSYLMKELKEVGGLDGQCILDGFPRTITQAEWLTQKIRSNEFKVDKVIHLTTPKEIAKRRLYKRSREDDKEDSIQTRFKIHDEQISQIIEKIEQSGVKVVEINGDNSVENVNQQIRRALNL